MNLLGDGVQGIAVVCVLLALVGGTAATSFSFGRRPFTVAKNFVAVTLASLLMVVGIGLELNRQNGWYPSLDDLLGHQPGAVADNTIGARNPATLFAGEKLVRTDDRRLPALPLPGQRLQHVTVPTGHGHSWAVDVLLPEGYFEPANAHRAWPVAMMIHGVPGSASAWMGRMSIPKLLDPLVRDHKVAPFIAVMPEVTPGGMDTECEIGPGGPTETEDWLSEKVPAYVTAHFRAMTARSAWVTAGYSAGGWCATMLPMLHPDRFGGGVSLGGYAQVWWGATKPTWSAASPQAKRLDLVDTARTRRPKVGLYVQVTRDDTQSWNSTKHFLAKVKAPTTVEAEVQPHGGHSFNVWIPGLQRGFTWLGKGFPGFHP